MEFEYVVASPVYQFGRLILTLICLWPNFWELEMTFSLEFKASVAYNVRMFVCFPV
jgi:hypothetical protein